MNGIQVKSYLLPENSKVSLNIEVDEIRRFNLDSATYKTLIEKLQKSTLLFYQNKKRSELTGKMKKMSLSDSQAIVNYNTPSIV